MGVIAEKCADFHRAQVVAQPTPLERMDRLSENLGNTNFYIKRDDLTGLGLGGNKVRKLEFYIGEAIARGADTVITVGGLQSNHARQTAAMAARFGLQCDLFLRHLKPNPSEAYRSSGNMLLNDLLGATLHLEPESSASSLANDMTLEGVTDDSELNALAKTLKASGRKPFVIPVGAAGGVGELAYALCAEEIIGQAQAMGFVPDWIIVANGSGGTQAGLVAGLKVLGSACRVYGAAVSDTDQTFRRQFTWSLARDALARLGSNVSVTEDDIIISGDYVGSGYGIVDHDITNAIRQLAQLEGLFVDPVYSGKALQALLALSAKGLFQKGENVVFLHTGGQPGLFAYPTDIANAL